MTLTPSRHAFRLGIASMVLLICVPAPAQTWDFKTYNSNGNSALGDVTLEPKGDGYVFRITAPGYRVQVRRNNDCWAGELKAAVEKTESTITITPSPNIDSGCIPIRFVINNDGSGGYSEFMEGNAWKRDPRDHLLTPKK